MPLRGGRKTMNSRQERLSELKDISRTIGRFFHLVGSLLFVFSMCLLADHPDAGTRIGPVFRATGFFLTTSWLLLRFASGLFPFSTKVLR
jgi:hypothetical protein